MDTAKATTAADSAATKAPERWSINTVAAQDVKRRGVVAIIDKLEAGPVHVLQHNRPAFVALREEHYQELVNEIEEARRQASPADVEARRVRSESPRELID